MEHLAGVCSIESLLSVSRSAPSTSFRDTRSFNIRTRSTSSEDLSRVFYQGYASATVRVSVSDTKYWNGSPKSQQYTYKGKVAESFAIRLWRRPIGLANTRNPSYAGRSDCSRILVMDWTSHSNIICALCSLAYG